MNQGDTFLLFRCAGSTLALPASLSRQALPLEGLTPLPGTRGVLLGLMPAAGRAIPVLDIEQMLALEAGPRTEDASLVLMIESGEHTLGLPVDEVIGFVSDDRPTFANNTLLTDEKVLGGYVGGGQKGRFLNTTQLFSEVTNQLTTL